MIKVILFDLGDTLEHNGTLREDALDTLDHLKDLMNVNDPPLFILGLASDNEFPNTTPDEARARYYNLLNEYGIADYFGPFNNTQITSKITLSKDVGATKDEDLELFMRTAIDKIGNTSFNQVIFITENCKHIDSANSLGIKTIFLKLNTNSAVNNGNNTITNLSESINIIEGMLNN